MVLHYPSAYPGGQLVQTLVTDVVLALYSMESDRASRTGHFESCWSRHRDTQCTVTTSRALYVHCPDARNQCDAPRAAHPVDRRADTDTRPKPTAPCAHNSTRRFGDTLGSSALLLSTDPHDYRKYSSTPSTALFASSNVSYLGDSTSQPSSSICRPLGRTPAMYCLCSISVSSHTQPRRSPRR